MASFSLEYPALSVSDSDGPRTQSQSLGRRVLTVASAACLIAAVVCVLFVAIDHGPVELAGVREGREIELKSLSGLKPVVNPFPDTYYNVFDPKITVRPHHRWSKRHVRDEVLRIMKLIEAARNWDHKNLVDENARASNFSFVIRKGITGIDKRIDELRKGLVEIGKDMHKAISKEDKPISEEEGEVQVEDGEEDKKKRGVWEELLIHKGKLNWERLLEQARQLQLQKTDAYQMKRDKVKFNRLDEEEARITKEMNRQLEEMELKMQSNFSRFKSRAETLRSDLDTVESNTKRDYGERGRVAVSLIGGMHRAMKDASDVEFGVKDAAKVEKDIDERVSQMHGKSDQFEKDSDEIEQTTEKQHDAIKEAASAAREMLEGLHENLNHVRDLREKVEEEIKNQQLEHENLEENDGTEMQKMRFALQDLQPALAKVESMAKKVQGMQSTVDTGIDKTIKELKTVQANHEAGLKHQKDLASDIKDAMNRMENMQNKGEVENVKKSYTDIQTQLTPISTEIALVQTFKDQVQGLNSHLDGELKKYKAVAEALFQRRKTWEKAAEEKDRAMKSTVDGEVSKELDHMQAITTAIDGVKAEVGDHMEFKAESIKVLGQLKSEMGDFTESLLMLDKKLSGQIEVCDTKIKDLKDLEKGLANPEEINVAGDQIGVKVEEVMNGLDDIEQQSKEQKQSEKQQVRNQRTLRSKLKELKSYLRSAIAKANSHLRKHSNLFERISCTCYDGYKLMPPSGKECIPGSLEDESTCEVCPEGSYCNRGNEVSCKLSCPSGEELSGECPEGSVSDTMVCSPCPADHFCQDGQRVPCKTTCDDGYLMSGTCPEGSRKDTIKCLPCPEGFWCKDGQQFECKTSCDDGQELVGECDSGSEEDTTSCETCPEGHYCSEGVAHECRKSCDDGFQLVGECPAGSLEDQTSCEPCPEDNWCAEGKVFPCTTTCRPGKVPQGKCEPGSTKDTVRCKWCPSGFWCYDGDAQECKTTCPAGQLLSGKCRRGSDLDTTTCSACPSGYWCENGVKHECKDTCDDGLLLQGECGVGSKNDTIACVPCPDGAFCKNGEAQECKSTCRPGKVLKGSCDEGSEKDTTSCETCPEDFWCIEGEAHECTKTCPHGQHVKKDCAPGSKHDVTCVDCRRGTFCKDGEVTDCKTTCSDGEYLVGQCRAASKEDTTQCLTCPEGNYCSDGKQKPCKTSCKRGEVLTGTCEAGAAEDTKQCLPCPEGHFCRNGIATPCRTSCPNGRLLAGECKATRDATKCRSCPAGSYCIAGLEYACQTSCRNGTQLTGSCDVGSASDTTICEPCEAGSYCRDGVAVPCKDTCEEGQRLEGFCAAGSKHDNTTCEECPVGFYCQDGDAKMCKTSCEPGELFVGECSEGSAKDATSCVDCPEGFYCRNGVQIQCRTDCPEDMTLLGSCPASSATDTTMCKSLGTPPPTMVVWWDHKSAFENVGPEGEAAEDRMGSETKLANAKSGSIEGSFPMAAEGATWYVQFYIGWPKAGDDYPHNFPETGAGSPSLQDEIKVEINGETEVYRASDAQQGHMQIITREITADALVYRFEFTSDNDNAALHPFISNAEVTILHDSTTGPEGEGFERGKSSFKGKCINTIDGKAVKKLFKQHDGYAKRQIAIEGEATVLVFEGSKLIQRVAVNKAKWRVRNIRPGQYTCIGIMPGFYSFYNAECVFEKDKEFFTYVMFSPRLRPGEARSYLSWGARPRDMDLYMLVPHKGGVEPPCEVNWNNKACSSSALTLDYDAKSGYGPETISLHKFRDGKYRVRVSEYRGVGDHKEWLLKSDSQVTLNSEGFTRKFSVHKDGFIKGRNWYVFTIDGKSKRVLPCNEMTCGHGYHDAKALGNDA